MVFAALQSVFPIFNMASIKNKLRSETRNSSVVFDLNVLSSQQKGSPSYCESYLAERIFDMEKKENISLETSRHIENLKGMQAVLQVLMANVDLQGKTYKTLRLSYMEFNEAFALFLSYNTTATTAMLSDRGQRKMFIDLICHPIYGIPVYVVKKQYLLLKSSDVDLDLFFEDFFSDERNQADNGLSPDEINDVIDSLDTAWDKKAVKVLLAAGHSNRQNVELGIGSRVSRYRRQVLTTIEAKKELRLKAKDFVLEDLTSRMGNIEKSISSQKNKLDTKSEMWSPCKLDELAEKIDDLQERKRTYEKYVSEKDNSIAKGFKEMVSRKYSKLVVEHRVGMRKASSGRPQALDEEDEKFILECVEQKSTAHGRRHDAVMYTGRRVKKRDFKNLANYSRISRGLKPIKSATTVFNRARPRNRKSAQAKRHLGLGLFCTKKPPKLQENDNILTHYQRAFKKGILLRQLHISQGSDANFNLSI